MSGEPWHGTVGGYTNHRCRCEDCRRANSEKCLEYRHRVGLAKPRVQYVAEVRAAAAEHHGTEGTAKRCRCDACRTAANAARNERRKHPNVAAHGRNSSYSNGCRCDACRAAHRQYERELRARKAESA